MYVVFLLILSYNHKCAYAHFLIIPKYANFPPANIGLKCSYKLAQLETPWSQILLIRSVLIG